MPVFFDHIYPNWHDRSGDAFLCRYLHLNYSLDEKTPQKLSCKSDQKVYNGIEASGGRLMPDSPGEVTLLLAEWSLGRKDALARLIPFCICGAPADRGELYV